MVFYRHHKTPEQKKARNNDYSFLRALGMPRRMAKRIMDFSPRKMIQEATKFLNTGMVWVT